MDNYDDIDWGSDDMFGGDMDFDDNFDMDPYKNKSFIAAATEGFLNTVVEGSIGSSDAVINTARAYLPSSFTTGLDRLRFLKDKGNELIREFQEGNYETVKSLQSIAKGIAGKISDENSFVKNKLESFSTKDFSSWEGSDGGGSRDDTPTMEALTDDDVSAQLSKLMENQSTVLESVGNGLNQMSAAVGGRTISAVMAGNKELIGIQSSMRDLLDYQRRVQSKMDMMKVELLARSYMLNAKFYKFMEKGIHAEIKELKKIVDGTNKSDYEKTSHWQATKGKMRDAVLTNSGGLLSVLKEKVGKEGRQDSYNAFESAVAQIATMIEMGEGLNPSVGMFGNMAGGMLGDYFMRELPRFFKQGPFKRFGERLFKNNPEYQAKYDSLMGGLNDVGNKFSYNMTTLPNMLQYYAEGWEDLDVDKYYDYDDYLAQMEEQGKTPMGRAKFNVINGLGKQGKQFANNLMAGINKSQGSKYILRQRNAKELTKLGTWKEINNVAIVDIIPGLLRMQLESMEKLRTGNDNYVAPTYSYQRGQFISRKNAEKVVMSDVFEHSSFSNASRNANALAMELDKDDNLLTKEERLAFSMALAKNADKQYGFNPYYYVNGIGSEDQGLNDRIASIIRKRFDLNDEKIKAYEESDLKDQFLAAAFGFNGEAGARLNETGSLAKTLADSLPNIQDTISASRSAGNDQILRELGIIQTKNGRDNFNMDAFWSRFGDYLKQYDGSKTTDNKELRGDIGDNDNPLHAGDTTSFGNGSRRDSSDISKKARKISSQADNMQETAVNTTKILNETMEKLVKQIDSYGKAMSKADFSKMKIDLGEIPDNLSSIRELIEKMQAYDSRQESLLEQIAGCVCRQAGGWNKLSDTEKSETLKTEAEGKKSIMQRLKEFSPRGLFNRGVEALINNQPLVLGGMLGGLGVLAMHDPKAAMLITGGIAAAKIYSKIGEYARGRNPDNDEDILDADGNVILKSSKLNNGDYYDLVEKRVIKEWKEIKGALYDVVSKSYITISELTGKLFGRDGRAIIISGLSKVRDVLVGIWNKVDIFGHLGSALTKGKEMFYQQDVYIKGEKEPRLTRHGFASGKYYCYNKATKEPYPIKGWNEIKGPVYELSQDGTLSQIISEGDIAQGLVTSSGVALDKLGQFAKWTGANLLDGLGKAKDYTLDKAGLLKEKAKEVFSNDYSGIEGRLDRIYYLLCDQFKVDPNRYGMDPTIDPSDPNTPKGPGPDFVDQVVGGAQTSADGEKTDPNETSIKSDYPDSIRLNSLQDQEEKEEKKKRDDFYDNVEGIRERMDENAGKPKDDKGEKKGLLGTIAGWLVGKDSFLKKLITNPIGFIAGGLMSNILKAPGRLISMGSLLFRGVLGIGSPIYSLLSWGFGGMMWGLRKLLFSNVETFADWAGGMRGRRRSRRRARRRGLKLGGKLGKLLMAGATAYGAYEGYQAVNGMVDTAKSARDIQSRSGEEYDRFFGDPNSEVMDESSENGGNRDQGPTPSTEPAYQSTLGEGLTTPEAMTTAALGVLQAKGTAKTLGVGSLNPLAEAGTQTVTEKAAEKLLGRTAGKVASKAIPLVGQALMAMDAYDGFTNKDEIGEIFNKKVINGRERLANGVSNVLDLGGAVSGTMNWMADKTGMEFLRQQGGMTRAIDGALSAMTWGPLKYLTPVGWLSMWETDISQPQNRVRLAMYGIAKGDSDLGRAIGVMEYRLNEFVKFNDNKAWFDEKAPIAEILNAFTTKNNPQETTQWFNLRFKPIYLTYQAALRVVGFNSLQDFDGSKAASVLRVVEQVRVTLQSISPYPLDIVVNIDPNQPLMARQQTETVITECMEVLTDAFKERKVGKDGLSEVTTKIKTLEEMSKGTMGKDESGVLNSIRSWSAKKNEEMMNRTFPTEASIKEIDISDLHKDQDTALDELTLIRLACYGNVDNNPQRVDAVLKLERYCESVTAYANGGPMFAGSIPIIYNMFKNLFRVTPAWEDEWVTWFNNRFLPVFKKWFEEVYKARRVKPQKGWITLSATNKYTIADGLIGLNVTIDNKDPVPIWDISESPFMFSESGTDSSVTKGYLSNLEVKSTDAKLKTPDLEMEKSKNKDMSGKTDATSSDDQQKIMDRVLGAKGIKRVTAGKLYDPNVPLTTPQEGNVSTYGNYGSTVAGALGQGPNDTNTTQLSNIENAASSYGSGGTNFSPESLQTKDGFKIDEKQAMKTIINEFVKQGITDNRVIAFALANAKSETGFQGRAESLNYPADRLPGIFKSTFGRNPGLAEKLGRVGNKPADQKAIANVAYGNKYGNKGGDDGWMYRGRGFTQLTFKGNYDAVGKAIGENIVDHPEKVTTDPVTAAKSAAGFFKIHPEIGKYIEQGNIQAAAKVVGREEKGIQNKVNYYPEFLKRLTEGDLKDLLKDDEGATDGKEEGQPNQVNQQPVSALPEDGGGASQTPPTKEEQAANQKAMDATQQAANKVNAPPQQPDGSADAVATAPVAPVTPPDVTDAGTDNVAKAETPTQTTAPVSEPSKPDVPPANNTNTPQQSSRPTPQDGVMKVSDEGVVAAIGALADVLSRGMRQNDLGGNNRRVNVD